MLDGYFDGIKGFSIAEFNKNRAAYLACSWQGPVARSINPVDDEKAAEARLQAQPTAMQTVSLPVWIPGSYLVREFSRHLQKLAAQQDGKPVLLRQLDKNTWQAECVASRPMEVTYEVYAFDPSVRAAWLDAQRGFFNGTSLCLGVQGQEKRPHAIDIVPPTAASAAKWELATALLPLKVNKRGFGTYQAADYDELVDCPVEMGRFWSADFKAGGVPHRLVVTGVPESFDGERLLDDTRRICEAEIRFWHDRPGRRKRPPFRHYLFLLNAVDDNYGGLEHRTSTALIASRRDLPRLGEARPGEGYTTLLGLISHEYFHTWNVKQLRPAEFTRYDYGHENYTQLLWFFEGFTSYYDDLFLRRCGRIDDATYLRLLGKTINQVLQAPGREVQSVAQASYDAWIKYYRQDENTPNATISYYSKGALVALCFDLTLRAEGRTTLDDVMRALWARCKGGPMTEADFAAVLKELGGRSFATHCMIRYKGRKSGKTFITPLCYADIGGEVVIVVDRAGEQVGVHDRIHGDHPLVADRALPAG